MDSSSGVDIAEALRAFTEEVLPMISGMVIDPATDRDAADWCVWTASTYPATLKALCELKHFDSERDADLYICGYFRGLQEALFQVYHSEPMKKKKAGR